jgi:hypothetical protein
MECRMFFLVMLFFVSFSLKCQTEKDSVGISKNSIYIELIGNSSTMFSIHYDRIIKQLQKSYMSLDVGFGYFPKHDILNPNFGIPISFNWTNRLYKRNHLETGIGLTYSSGTLQQTIDVGSKTESLRALYGSLRIGYKFQKPKKGLFLKAAFTPLIKIYQFSKLEQNFSGFLPFVGLSVGYSF